MDFVHLDQKKNQRTHPSPHQNIRNLRDSIIYLWLYDKLPKHATSYPARGAKDAIPPSGTPPWAFQASLRTPAKRRPTEATGPGSGMIQGKASWCYDTLDGWNPATSWCGKYMVNIPLLFTGFHLQCIFINRHFRLWRLHFFWLKSVNMAKRQGLGSE